MMESYAQIHHVCIESIFKIVGKLVVFISKDLRLRLTSQ